MFTIYNACLQYEGVAVWALIGHPAYIADEVSLIKAPHRLLCHYWHREFILKYFLSLRIGLNMILCISLLAELGLNCTSLSCAFTRHATTPPPPPQQIHHGSTTLPSALLPWQTKVLWCHSFAHGLCFKYKSVCGCKGGTFQSKVQAAF